MGLVFHVFVTLNTPSVDPEIVDLKHLFHHSHTCDRVAMLQLEICKFLAGDLVS